MRVWVAIPRFRLTPVSKRTDQVTQVEAARGRAAHVGGSPPSRSGRLVAEFVRQQEELWPREMSPIRQLRIAQVRAASHTSSLGADCPREWHGRAAEGLRTVGRER